MISELVVLVELSSVLFRQRPLALQARCGGTHFELGVLTNGTTPPVLNRQRKDSIRLDRRDSNRHAVPLWALTSAGRLQFHQCSTTDRSNLSRPFRPDYDLDAALHVSPTVGRSSRPTTIIEAGADIRIQCESGFLMRAAKDSTHTKAQRTGGYYKIRRWVL